MDRGTHELGLALDLLASTLSWAQQRREALPVAAEAVAAWRAIAAVRLSELGSLADALSKHGFYQWHVGADDYGLASAEEAEAIVRELVTVNPGRWEGTLVNVLGSAWRSFDWHGQTERALAATEDVVRIRRALGDGALPRALGEWATMLDRAGRPEEAQSARAEQQALTAVVG